MVKLVDGTMDLYYCKRCFIVFTKAEGTQCGRCCYNTTYKTVAGQRIETLWYGKLEINDRILSSWCSECDAEKDINSIRIDSVGIQRVFVCGHRDKYGIRFKLQDCEERGEKHDWELICRLGYVEEGKDIYLYRCKDCTKIKGDV